MARVIRMDGRRIDRVLILPVDAEAVACLRSDGEVDG
jgi:hypothetical protein